MLSGRAAVLLACVACSAPTAPPSPQLAYERLRGEALGTTWSVQWGPADRVATADVEAAVVAVLREVDQRMSTWREDSELSRARAHDGAMEVSPETAEVVGAAVELARQTGGAFDPTVLPLMELWGLHGEPRTTWPTRAEIAAVKTGWRRVGLRYRAAAVEPGDTPAPRPLVPLLDTAGTAMDLSAIAKGHAVDRVARALSRLGATDVFVEVGGEVATTGHRADGTPWRVGVEQPVVGSDPSQGLAATVELTTGAVATSGNYRNRYEIDGRVVHHTLDPRTGMPAESATASATVVAPDCRTADGWATALMVLGEHGLPMIEARPDLEAWLILEDGQIRQSSGAAQMVAAVTDSAD